MLRRRLRLLAMTKKFLMPHYARSRFLKKAEIPSTILRVPVYIISNFGRLSRSNARVMLPADLQRPTQASDS